MITITGGKLTTWRRMAKMTVDRLVERDARDAPCRTQEIPLGQAIDAQELPRVEGVPEHSYAALAARYGHAAHEVLALAAERGELAQPIVAGLPDLLAEAVLAARQEQAAGSPTCCCGAPAWACWRRASSRRGRAGGARRRRARGRARLGSAAYERRDRALPRGGPRRGPARLVSPAALRPAPSRRLRAGAHVLELGERPLLMGIVNASPDSFSDGGRHPTLDDQVRLAEQLLQAGADMLDVGGESATTGARRSRPSRRSSASCR